MKDLKEFYILRVTMAWMWWRRYTQYMQCSGFHDSPSHLLVVDCHPMAVSDILNSGISTLSSQHLLSTDNAWTVQSYRQNCIQWEENTEKFITNDTFLTICCKQQLRKSNIAICWKLTSLNAIACLSTWPKWVLYLWAPDCNIIVILISKLHNHIKEKFT